MKNEDNAAKKGWFVLNVLSGAEQGIINQIKLNYESAGLKDCFEEIYSPTVAIESGKKTRNKNLTPGYIFIKMEMNEKTKDAIMSVPRVYSFLKSQSGKPLRVSEKEYNEMVAKITAVHASNVEGVTFAVGDTVKIKSGSFNEFKGTVIAIDKQKKLLTLSILVFQRETQVSVSFEDVEKIEK